MFKIEEVFAGWISILVTQNIDKYISFSNRITLSYIEDVKYLLDKLFLLEDEQDKEYEFDAENVFYNIKTSRKGETLKISIKYIEDDLDALPQEYSFDYHDFLKEYVEEMESQKESYLKNFAYLYEVEESYEWDNKYYKRIKEEIHD